MPHKNKRFNPDLQYPHIPVIPKNNPHGLFFLRTFQGPKKNWLVAAGGPNYVEQASAILDHQEWEVLNPFLLGNAYTQQDEKLLRAVNALKGALQTFGPTPANYAVTTQHKTNNEVFHTNIHGTTGTTYEVEWAIIDREKRIVALLGFDKHENYPFRQSALTGEEKQRILQDPRNIALQSRENKTKDALRKKAAQVSNSPMTERESTLLKASSKPRSA